MGKHIPFIYFQLSLHFTLLLGTGGGQGCGFSAVWSTKHDEKFVIFVQFGVRGYPINSCKILNFDATEGASREAAFGESTVWCSDE